jgi:L-serine dehydratase
MLGGFKRRKFKKIDTDKIEAKMCRNQKFWEIDFRAEKEIPFIYGKHLVLNMQKSLDFHPNGHDFQSGF